jgi:molecular chaperone GrpE
MGMALLRLLLETGGLWYTRAMQKTPGESELDFEPEDELGAAGAAKVKLQKMREELEKVKAERQEYLDGWQRAKADAVNLKRETERQASRTAEMLREALVHDLIPALDSFDMAATSEQWATLDSGWRSGMDMVRDQLIGALRSHGIERYGKVGERFDHALHDAIEERDDVAGESGTIARVLRSGYKASDRVLRAAQVVVKK